MLTHAHISGRQLALYADSGLSPPQQRSVAQHVQGCATCRDHVAALQTMMAALASDDPPVAATLVRAPTGPAPASAWRFARRPAVITGLAASVALLLALRSTPPAHEMRSKAAHVTDTQRWTGIQAFHTQGGQALAPLTTHLAAHDGLVFSYLNRSATPFAYLLVFAVDGAGQIRWYYPAYSHVAEVAQSIAIANATQPTLLPDEIKQPLAPGPLQINALFSQTPMSVRQIEAAVATGQLPALAQQPGHFVQTLQAVVD